jgi:hypothetical protein
LSATALGSLYIIDHDESRFGSLARITRSSKQRTASEIENS